MARIAIIATLDTKGAEVAYLRDRLNTLGVQTLVIDSGILGEPQGITPDISHEEVARRGGTTLHAVQTAGSRGAAVDQMRSLLIRLVEELYDQGEIAGGISVGGVGSVMGAAALQQLPLGAPKFVIAPTASGRHEFAPYVGTADVFTVHSVVDILGLNPIAATVFDNVAAAVAGILRTQAEYPAETRRAAKYVGVTMLGNTTQAVEALRDELAAHGYEAVVFHSSGVGGPSMEERARAGDLVGVIDYTTNEIVDHLTGGIHDAGSERLTVVGRLGLPQVVLPGCVDFSVFAAAAVPERLRDRPMYTHNPEYTLVRSTGEEMAYLGTLFAERINLSTGPVVVLLPTGGLSVPNKPGGEFFDPAADQRLFEAIRQHLRPDIEIVESDRHINDPELGRTAARLFVSLIEQNPPARTATRTKEP